MKPKFLTLLMGTLFVAFAGCSKEEQFKTGESYHGFKLMEKRFVEEINAEGLLFEHEKSGARLLKIAADDPNKTFNIAFKTAPETDYGTPHIMEHSVLNGSKNFPVKSPFDVLLKGSLNTFLNAMTGADITTYPVASMNDKDYFNLMHVYLDAVFNPLLYSDPKILQQEGWHYELTAKDEPVTYKGVVYNEMKGAFSSPQRELGYQTGKILFPDNTYGVSSGGYPAEITRLTQEHFVDFHKKYYHPSNSHILLYGDADLNRELEFIDREYLSDYERSDDTVKISLQKPFDAMKEAESVYAVQEGAPTDNQTFLSLSWVVGQSTDRELCMTFDVLADALVNNESAPLRRALQEADIGRDVRASFSEMQQNVFRINVQNANPEDKERFREIVFKTMEEAAANGLDKSMVEGIINRMEFNLKEGDSPQKGLMYVMMTYQPWFFGDDPFAGLEYNKPLEKVKKALTGNLLEEAITEHLINNPHALLMVLKPEPGLQAKIDRATAEQLAAYKASLSDEELEQLIAQTKELIEHQQREDTPEALATIPMLELSDISKDIEWYPVKEEIIAGMPLIHYDDFTNEIVYANLYFDLTVLSKELLPYGSLLNALLGKLSTENYSYGDLTNALNIHTGGFYTYTNAFFENRSDEQLLPKFTVTAKATTEKADMLFTLLDEILTKTSFEDTERLKELISRHQARVDSDIRNNGLNYAMTRLRSYYAHSGAFDELTGGLEYYRFLTDLSENFDGRADDIRAKLEETARLLFTATNATVGVTCNSSDLEKAASGINHLAAALPATEKVPQAWSFDFEKSNEGLLTASKVQYVVKGYNFKKLGFDYTGKMLVMNQVLSTDWLQSRVRVMGGAYGGFSGFSSTGDAFFASYRDPNLAETVDNFDQSPEFLSNLEVEESEITRYIIGTIARIDRPRNTAGKGSLAFQRYFEKTTPEFLKAEREAILSTTEKDIKSMAPLLTEILNQDALCVYGNEEKIRDNKALFGALVKITE